LSHSLTPIIHPDLAEHERQRCEVWTRVMGYHRPMASFNIGKQGEFHERRYFVEPGIGCAATLRAHAQPALVCS
jgi:Anaerobic ribonucleoside-triphosphate reductase